MIYLQRKLRCGNISNLGPYMMFLAFLVVGELQLRIKQLLFHQKKLCSGQKNLIIRGVKTLLRERDGSRIRQVTNAIFHPPSFLFLYSLSIISPILSFSHSLPLLLALLLFLFLLSLSLNLSLSFSYFPFFLLPLSPSLFIFLICSSNNHASEPKLDNKLTKHWIIKSKF